MNDYKHVKITNDYIIINDLIDIQEPYESWMDLCYVTDENIKHYKIKYNKIVNLSKYFIPTNTHYFFNNKQLNIENLKLLFNTLNITYSKKTNLNNIIISLKALYPDYKRFYAIDNKYNTNEDNIQLFQLLFSYIIINSKHGYRYLQSDSYLMAMCRRFVLYTKNEDKTKNENIQVTIYLLFKTILIKKHYNKFFFADEDMWIGQYFFKWSIFNILLKKRPDLFKYYWEHQHPKSHDKEDLIEFKYIIENTIFGLISISPPFINNFENIDVTIKIYKELLKNNIQTIFSYYAAYCIHYLPDNYQITNHQDINKHISLFSCHTSTSWSKTNIFNNKIPPPEICEYTNNYFSPTNFEKIKNSFYLYTKIEKDATNKQELLLLPYYTINPQQQEYNILSFFMNT